MKRASLKIVVIDGQTINPGDLSWKRLESFGEVTVYQQSTAEEAVERLRDADIAFVNKVVFNQTLIDALPRLRFISLTATGYNNLDITYLKQKGILVSNVKGYGDYAVAQHTISLLLELCNRVGYYNGKSRDGAWTNSGNFCFYDQPMTELLGKKMGIIGWGNIGSKVGAIARTLGMEVLYYSRSRKEAGFALQVDSLDEIFSDCDVISLHCLLTPETALIINGRTLGQMKCNAFLLNTSRGGLVDEQALYHALVNGQIAGAGLDVLTVEPPKEDHILFSAPNCIITPHNAWTPASVRQRLMDMAIDNLEAFLNGHPVNLVN
jgi:glycerate dehydrogenase